MKHWKPAKKTVQLEPAQRPSRIRREPLRRGAEDNAAKKAYWRSAEWDRRRTVAGVLLFGVGIAATVLGVSIVTFSKDDPAAAARAAEFHQCYEGGPNCVVDGKTFYLAGQRVQIAGIAAPAIEHASCEAERDRGIDSAMRLAYLLNSGKVMLGGPLPGADGEPRRKVQVGGRDVGEMMIAGNAARPDDGSANWCG